MNIDSQGLKELQARFRNYLSGLPQDVEPGWLVRDHIYCLGEIEILQRSLVDSDKSVELLASKVERLEAEIERLNKDLNENFPVARGLTVRMIKLESILTKAEELAKFYIHDGINLSGDKARAFLEDLKKVKESSE